MFKAKALSQGSVCPALKEGLLRLYGFRFCPYVKRILLVLQYFEVPFDVVNVNMKLKPDWFIEKTPTGQVPLMEVDGKILYESTICSRYLDQVYGGNRLYGKDSWKEAQQSMILMLAEKVNGLFFTFMKDPTNIEEKKQDSSPVFKKLEAACSGGFFGGTAPNFCDLMAYPLFERLYTSKEVVGAVFFDETEYPKLTSWKNLMHQQDFVKACYEDPSIQVAFIKQYLDPKCEIPDYDIAL